MILLPRTLSQHRTDNVTKNYSKEPASVPFLYLV